MRTPRLLLLLPLLLGLLLIPAPGANAAGDVHVGWGGWRKIDFGMKLTRAAKILHREAYDGCGGYPLVQPPPRQLLIGHPMTPLPYDLAKVRVDYLGGYAPNIHVPHGIHPGMRVRRALRLMGPDRHEVTAEYTHGWYELGPHGNHALLIKTRDGKVVEAAVMGNRKQATALIKNPGC